MKRTTIWMITGVYYVSHILGIVAFSYDYDTGKAKTKWHITLYCSIMSLVIFGTVPLLFQVDWTARSTKGPDLHHKINALMCLIRIAAVLVTVFLNWTKRSEFIKTLNDYQHFRCQFVRKFQISAKVEEYFENSLRSKFFWGFLANIILFVGSYDIFRGIFKVKSSLTIIALCSLVTVLNVIMTHYYFALMNVNTILAAINEEVKRILNSSAELFKRQRLKQIKPGAFITQCCQLADDLDFLAMAQYNIQQLTNRINQMYDIQGTCVILTIYMNNIGVMYMSYMLVQHELLYQEYGKWILVVPCALFFYYVDLNVYVMGMFSVIDYFKNTGYLLKNRQPWLPTLDVRLERSLKNFSLQIASFPLDTKYVGLFELNRPMVFAVFSSTISNAIVFMQYDYKNAVNL